jgi:hypothetical protein
MAWNTDGLFTSGTRGRLMPHATSQKKAGPLDLDSPHCQGGGLTGLQRATSLLKVTLGGAAPQTHQLTRHEE